jgi:aromatic-L-amino-acid decarboxylase
VANLIALGAARQHAYERLGHDAAKDGLLGLRRGRIYGSAEMHHSLLKAAGLLGLGRAAVELVPVDDNQRVDVKALRSAVERDVAEGIVPVAVVGIAGTTNTGAIDDLAALADVAQDHGTWFHIDGAYGLFGRLDPRVSRAYDAVSRADSVIVDAHKWLCVPTGIGATFVRDSELLGRAFTGEPSDYIEGAFESSAQDSPWQALGLPFHDWTLDLSAPTRGLVVWAALHEIGVDGLRQRIIRDNDYARRVADLVRADPHLELLAEPELSICCFRYRRDGLDEDANNELNQQLLRRLHVHSEFVPSGTWVNGHFALRPCFINPRATETVVDGLVAAARRLGDEL